MGDRILHAVKDRPGFYLMYCPGCRNCHGVWTEIPNERNGAVWSFDGNMEKPTFNPSVLINDVREGKPYVCHSFVREGKIQFLSDCTHQYAGQTLDLEKF